MLLDGFMIVKMKLADQNMLLYVDKEMQKPGNVLQLWAEMEKYLPEETSFNLESYLLFITLCLFF